MGSPFNIAFGQQRYVILNGTVTNEAGDALPQATVYIQGGSFSATTGDDGRFRLRVPAGACRIVCSMVGYEQQVYELTLDRDHRLDLVFNFIDLENHNSMIQKTIVTENFTGNGQLATFSGIVDLGNGEFLTGLVVSEPKDASQGGGGSTGEVTHPDSVWVAALDADLNVKRIYRDDRISYASGRFKSQYYSQIAKASDGTVYVFSGSYDGNTTKPAGALRIKKDAADFDATYYFNIEAESGGYRFRKVWHITEDYFLLEVYNDLEYGSSTPATQYAVVKMEDKTFKWVTQGFPAKDDITATGLPFADNGKIYFPVTTASAQPTVYVIDPASATAKAGLVVEAEGIASLSRFTY